MARTAAELVAALDSGEPSRVLRTPEGRYTTQVLDFCKELWEIDPLAQDPGVRATIAALPHPSHWEDEAAVRTTIAQWLSVLSVASSQFSKDPLAWRDRTSPPETHRDRPWINSFTFKPLPGQLPSPFTMGTETWHRSGGGGIRMVAGKDPASYTIYSASGPLAWRTATTMDLRKYQEEGLQGYGIRSPFPNAPTHLLTLDRLYSHLLYCVMDCPPPGYEPAPIATWKVRPFVAPSTRFGPVVLTLECVTAGVAVGWSTSSSGGGVWERAPDAPVAYRKYSKGDAVSFKVNPPAGGWGREGTTLSVTLDGAKFGLSYSPPTAQWEAKDAPPLTRAEGGRLKPTLKCTTRGYIWGGWHYAAPIDWQHTRSAGDPDYNTLYEVGNEVSLEFALTGPVTPDKLLTSRSAALTINGVTARARYQPALAGLKGATTHTADPSSGYLSTSLIVTSPGYLAADVTRSTPQGWTGSVRKELGTRGTWVTTGDTYETFASRDPGTPKSQDATLSLTYQGTTASASYAAPWATWEINGEATGNYMRFTFKCLTEGKPPHVIASYSPALPSGTSATFQLETPVGANDWSERGHLGSLRYTFSKPLTHTTTTTLKLVQADGTPIGQEASATFMGEPLLSIKDPFSWLANSHAVYGEIKVDSPGVIQSQGWTQSPANGNVQVLYYPAPGQGEVPTFPLTVRAGVTFLVTCTWLASQDDLAKSLTYRLGTQQWRWTS